MKTFSTKKLIIMLIGFIVYAIGFFILVLVINQAAYKADFVPAPWLNFWGLFALFYSIYGYLRLWFWPTAMVKRLAVLPPPGNPAGNRANPETITLLIDFLYLISPDLYGLVLFFMGLPVTQYYFFTGAAAAVGIGWIGEQLWKSRTKEGNEPQSRERTKSV